MAKLWAHRPNLELKSRVRLKRTERYTWRWRMSKDSESVNRALRLLLDLAKQEVPQNR